MPPWKGTGAFCGSVRALKPGEVLETIEMRTGGQACRGWVLMAATST